MILLYNLLILLSILLSWIYLFLVFSGIGLAFLEQKKQNTFTSFWVGWLIIIFFLQIWHIFFPVNRTAFLLISSLGLLNFIHKTKENIKQKYHSFPKISLFLIISIGIWLAYQSTIGQWNYDSGLYHLNTIRWLNSFPIIPGLGNLHGRLAFNCSYFLYPALLEEWGLWEHQSQYIANGIILWVFLSQILLSFKESLYKNDKSISFLDIFWSLLILPFFCLPELLGNISSPSPDLAISILTMLTAISFLSIEKEKNLKDLFPQSLLITLLTATGITIKLSSFIYSFTIFIANLSFLWIKSKNQTILNQSIYQIIKILFVFTFIIVIWIIRGIILSGYIAYPSAWGGVSVPWRIPQESVINMLNWTFSWARTPQSYHWKEVLSNWNWITPWILRNSRNPFILIFPTTLIFITLPYLIIRRRINFKKDSSWIILIPLILSISYWFFTAPSPRFGSTFLWVLAIFCISKIIYDTNNPKRRIISFILIVAFSSSFFNISLLQLRHIKFLFKEKILLNLPPSVPLKIYTTHHGLKIYVPEIGDQCWDAPLPASIYPHPDLRLRKEGDLRSGFVLDPKKETDASVGMHEEWTKKWLLPIKN